MKDDELAGLLRKAAQEETAAFESFQASPEGRAMLTERPALGDNLAARALADLQSPAAAQRLPVGPGFRARPGIRQRRLGLVAVLAAAGVALFLGRGRQPTLPPYQVVVVAGAEQELRGAPPPAARLVVRAGEPFALTLRPATRVSGSVVVRAQLIGAGGPRFLDIDAEPNPAGVVQVRGTWPAAGLPPGAGPLLLAVGRPDRLPTDPSRASPAGDGWWILRVELIAPGP